MGFKIEGILLWTDVEDVRKCSGFISRQGVFEGYFSPQDYDMYEVWATRIDTEGLLQSIRIPISRDHAVKALRKWASQA